MSWLWFCFFVYFLSIFFIHVTISDSDETTIINCNDSTFCNNKTLQCMNSNKLGENCDLNVYCTNPEYCTNTTIHCPTGNNSSCIIKCNQNTCSYIDIQISESQSLYTDCIMDKQLAVCTITTQKNPIQQNSNANNNKQDNNYFQSLFLTQFTITLFNNKTIVIGDSLFYLAIIITICILLCCCCLCLLTTVLFWIYVREKQYERKLMTRARTYSINLEDNTDNIDNTDNTDNPDTDPDIDNNIDDNVDDNIDNPRADTDNIINIDHIVGDNYDPDDYPISDEELDIDLPHNNQNNYKNINKIDDINDMNDAHDPELDDGEIILTTTPKIIINRKSIDIPMKFKYKKKDINKFKNNHIRSRTANDMIMGYNTINNNKAANIFNVADYVHNNNNDLSSKNGYTENTSTLLTQVQLTVKSSVQSMTPQSGPYTPSISVLPVLPDLPPSIKARQWM